MLSPAKEDIDTVGRSQKSNFLLLVASNERNDDYLALLALEIVDGCDTKELAQVFLFNGSLLTFCNILLVFF